MKLKIDGSKTSRAAFGVYQASARHMSLSAIVIGQNWRPPDVLASQSNATAQPRLQGWNPSRPRRWTVPQPRRWRVWRPRAWTTRRWEKHLVPVPVYVEARER